jgi:Malonyl-CoA decarboxylase C-terminal domain
MVTCLPLLDGTNGRRNWLDTVRVQGLAGLNTGRRLLHSAVTLLRRQHPHCRFGTLSPIPGFRRWLRNRLMHEDQTAALYLHEKPGRQMLVERLLMSDAEMLSGACSGCSMPVLQYFYMHDAAWPALTVCWPLSMLLRSCLHSSLC